MNIIRIFIIGRGNVSKKIETFFKEKKIKKSFKLEKSIEKSNISIDFSNFKKLEKNLRKNNKPIIIGTTGFNKENICKIKKKSKKFPIFLSYNLNTEIYKEIKILNNKILNIHEIKDIHKKKKIDSPSGTSIMLGKFFKIKNFESIKKEKNIGTHILKTRKKYDVFTFIHKNKNFNSFIKGLIKAIFYIIKKKKGLYSSGKILNI